MWRGVFLAITTLSWSVDAEPVESTPVRAEEWFVDSTGSVRNFRLEYQRWRSESRYDPDYLLAALEVSGLVAIGTAQYWLTSKAQSADWDFPPLSERLTLQAVRLDNNTFTTNNLLHPMAGLGYYAFSRGSGLSLPEAIFFTETASFLWEALLEWRENISFNDMVLTPVGGIAMGEFTFHLADYLNSGGSSRRQELARWTFGSPVRLNRSSSTAIGSTLPKDALGLSSAYWHRFITQYDFTMLEGERGSSNTAHGVTLRAELVSMPGFLRPGKFDTWFADGNFTEASGRMMFGGPTGLQEADLWFSSCFAGYYGQDFAKDGASGIAGMLGVGTALRYLDEVTFEHSEQIATAHYLGPHFGLWLAGSGFDLKLIGDVHGDFAAI
ncbi:MAG TPA: DUF3943 domain-containing protein, partial [Polyangiaceae bacterium]|nr:DUF3943 domain-containing protein [Polyangiaceae bacterium]